MKIILALLALGCAHALIFQPHFRTAPACVEKETCLGSDFKMGKTSPGTVMHKAVVAVKRQNEDVIKKHLYEMSDPKHERYQQWMSWEEVASITAYPEATETVVRWAKSSGLETNVTRTGDYVDIFGPISTFNAIFATEFKTFSSKSKGLTIHRALYSNLPVEISQYVDHVAGITDFPQVLRNAPEALAWSAKLAANGKADPALLHSFYKIPNGIKHDQATQSVFEGLGQSYNPSDLADFESRFNIPSQKIFRVFGTNSPSSCLFNPNSCAEASLDVQYIIGVAPGSRTDFWSISGDGTIFFDWAKQVSNDPKAALVHSISYGSIEAEEDPATLDRFDRDVQMLGSKGLTIFVSSGDDGVANFGARSNPSGCGFHPSFPATSPHVTAVGATQGPEFGKKEVACSSETNGLITTGGGFSTVFKMPSYQTSAANKYMNMPGVNLPPKSMFNTGGRGYPDIAMLGHNYVVAISGGFYLVSGTSASSPVAAATTSVVNAQRFNAGKGALGFINPTIYANGDAGASAFNDITEGKNNCAAGQPGSNVCCQYGFTAAQGWDPLTGWGSINFPQYSATLMAKN